MRKLLLALMAVLCFSSAAFAQYVKVLGQAEHSAKVVVSGTSSTNSASITYPLATIDVYNAGTTNHATLYAAATGGGHANPFTADSFAIYDFFIAPGAQFDVRISGVSNGTTITPFTRSGYTAPGTPGTTLAQCSGTNDTSLLTAAFAVGGAVTINGNCVATSALVIGTYNNPVKATFQNNLTTNSSVTVGFGSQLLGLFQNPYKSILSYTGAGDFIIMAGYDGTHPAVNDEDDRSSVLANFYIQGTYLGKGVGGPTTQRLIVLKDGFSHGTLQNLYIRNAGLGMYGFSDTYSIDKNLFLNVAFRNPLKQAVYLEGVGTTPQAGFVEMNTFINLVLRNDDSSVPTFQMKGSPLGGATPRLAGSTAFIDVDASFAGNDTLGTMFDFTDVSAVQFFGGEIQANKYGIVAHSFCQDINSFGVNQSQSVAVGAVYFLDTGTQAANQFNFNSLQSEINVGTGVPGRRVFIRSQVPTPGDALVVGRNNIQGVGMMAVDYNSTMEQGLELRNNAASGKTWTIGDGVGVAAGTFGIYNHSDSRVDFAVSPTGAVSQTKAIIGGGTTLTKVLKGTVTIDPASINATTASSQTFTLTGAVAGDSLILNPPAAGLTAGMLVCQVFVSAADTITITFFNTTGAPIDLASASWTYTLIRS